MCFLQGSFVWRDRKAPQICGAAVIGICFPLRCKKSPPPPVFLAEDLFQCLNLRKVRRGKGSDHAVSY